MLPIAALLSALSSSLVYQYDGRVLQKDGTGLPDVQVTLAGTGQVAQTDSSGQWSLVGAEPSLGGLSGRKSMGGTSLTGRLRVVDGRLFLDLAGRNVAGRRLEVSPTPGGAMRTVPARRMGQVSGGGPDTLVYRLEGKVFLRDTVWGRSAQGILRTWEPQLNASVTHGYLQDVRDGRIYRTIGVGPWEWMAENLAYAGGDSSVGRCYGDSIPMCWDYGRLYDWAEVRSGETVGGRLLRGVCPEGWHVPKDEEWNLLSRALDPSGKGAVQSFVGKGLWPYTVNSHDPFGFRALPGGLGMPRTWRNEGVTGIWWTGSTIDAGGNYPWFRQILVPPAQGFSAFPNLLRDTIQPDLRLSVRCARDVDFDTSLLEGLTRLSWLLPSSGSLVPPFRPEVHEYSDTVGSEVASIWLQSMAADSSRTVWYSLDGAEALQASNRLASIKARLALQAGGEGTFEIRVGSASGWWKPYRVKVLRRDSTGRTRSLYEVPWNGKVEYGTMNDAAGRSYRTVRIGGQTWMAENLAYPGRDGTLGKAPSEDPDTLAKYGRSYLVSEVREGNLCPEGWRVPTAADWGILRNVVDPTEERLWIRLFGGRAWPQAIDSLGFRAIASNALGPASWWDAEGGHFQPRGALTALLRASVRCVGDSLRKVPGGQDTALAWLGIGGDSLVPEFDPRRTYYRDTVAYARDSVWLDARAGDPVLRDYWLRGGRPVAERVQVALEPGGEALLQVMVVNPEGASRIYGITVHRRDSLPWKDGIPYGEVADPTGRTYRTVEIGAARWMAENLAYAGNGGELGRCPAGDPDSCARYGRLYTWMEAYRGMVPGGQDSDAVQGICPDGWHLPSVRDWAELGRVSRALPGADTGGALRAQRGWSYGWNGNDGIGFRALPAGSGGATGSFAAWWSADLPVDGRAREAVLDGSGRGLALYPFPWTTEPSQTSDRGALALRCVQDP